MMSFATYVNQFLTYICKLQRLLEYSLHSFLSLVVVKYIFAVHLDDIEIAPHCLLWDVIHHICPSLIGGSITLYKILLNTAGKLFWQKVINIHILITWYRHNLLSNKNRKSNMTHHDIEISRSVLSYTNDGICFIQRPTKMHWVYSWRFRSYIARKQQPDRPGSVGLHKPEASSTIGIYGKLLYSEMFHIGGYMYIDAQTNMAIDYRCFTQTYLFIFAIMNDSEHA